jgi:hypothetical protein
MADATPDPLAIEPTPPGEPPASVKRDRWGRYLLPHPETGNRQAWTRATTFAKSASDTFALALWQNRMVAKGMSMRPDLYALAASTHPDDKDTLGRIAEQAKEAAGGSAASSIGTALHAFTEQQDRGEQPVVPEPWAVNVSLYTKCLSDHGLVIDADFIETVVLVPEFDVAGTLDRIGTLPGAAHPRIVDLKTGKDLSYGWMEIAVQLFLYSRATHWYDVETETLHEMPKVDQDVGLVIHLPVNQKIAALYEVDLSLGATVAQHIAPIRELRKRKDYAKLISPPVEAVDPDDSEWSDPPGGQEPKAESAKIAESVIAGNAADKAATEGPRFVPEKGGKVWVIRDTVTGFLASDTDSGATLQFKLKRDAKAHVEMLSSPAAIGRKAAADIAAMHKAEEWPDDEDDAAKAETDAFDEGEIGKDPWMAAIFTAESYPELQDYYRRGTAAGTWNEKHTKAAAARKAELEDIEREKNGLPSAAEEGTDLPDDDW